MNKSIVINHSYDEELYVNEKQKSDKMIFRFIGHLDQIRTPINLLKALKELKEYDNNISQKVRFEFYGDLSDTDKLYIINNELFDVVQIKKAVGYIESLSLMKSSNWLIHIDANINDVLNDNIFFAAKLADYIGTGNKIIGITMPTGASADILRNHGKLCISNCTSEIVNYLYLIIYKNYELPQDNLKEELNAKNVAKIFDEMVTKIKKMYK